MSWMVGGRISYGRGNGEDREIVTGVVGTGPGAPPSLGREVVWVVSEHGRGEWVEVGCLSVTDPAASVLPVELAAILRIANEQVTPLA